MASYAEKVEIKVRKVAMNKIIKKSLGSACQEPGGAGNETHSWVKERWKHKFGAKVALVHTISERQILP